MNQLSKRSGHPFDRHGRQSHIRTAASLLSACMVVLLVFACRPAFAADSERLQTNLLKNGETVRAAFREVMRQPHRFTVEIRSDGSPVALGTVVAADGWVFTKASELTGHIICRFHDDRELPARLVGIDYGSDLALLKVEAQGLPVVEWSTAGDPAVGRWLATPGMDEIPIAVGIVGAGRQRIPAERGLLGITVDDAESGLVIQSVQTNSGADEAGVQSEDVIEKLNGEPIRTYADLVAKVHRFRSGDIVGLSLRRNGTPMDFLVILGEPFTNYFERSGFQNRIGGELSRRRSGFRAVLPHDSLLDPSACGGPVIDLTGKAVGINIARAGRTETLAIPVQDVLRVLEKLKSGRRPAPDAWATRVAEPPMEKSETPAGPELVK